MSVASVIAVGGAGAPFLEPHTHALPVCGKLTCKLEDYTLTVGCTNCPHTNTVSIDGSEFVRVHIGREGSSWTCLVLWKDQQFTYTDTPASTHHFSWFPVSYVTLLGELEKLGWASSRTDREDPSDSLMWFNSTTFFTKSAVAEEEEGATAADADEDEENEPIEEEDDESDQSILARARRAANAYPTHDWTECDATPTRSKWCVEIAVRAITSGVAWKSANAATVAEAHATIAASYCDYGIPALVAEAHAAAYSAGTKSIQKAASVAATADGIRDGREHCSSCNGFSSCCQGSNCGTCSSCTSGDFCPRCFYIETFTAATTASV